MEGARIAHDTADEAEDPGRCFCSRPRTFPAWAIADICAPGLECPQKSTKVAGCECHRQRSRKNAVVPKEGRDSRQERTGRQGGKAEAEGVQWSSGNGKQ